jgi:predicted Kef-type K+ transport protein
MFKRLKGVLVESYVGAIALGYLLAESVLYLVTVVAAPVTAWATEDRYRTEMSRQMSWADLAAPDLLEPLVKFILLLVFWYILIRWLYYERPERPTQPAPGPVPNP